MWVFGVVWLARVVRNQRGATVWGDGSAVRRRLLPRVSLPEVYEMRASGLSSYVAAER